MLMIGSVFVAVASIWFCADFDQPAELGGHLFEQNMNSGRIVEGRFGKGYAFESSESRAENAFWRLGDAERMVDFPWQNGSFACWFLGGEPGNTLDAFFSYGGFWSYDWSLSGSGFTADKGRGAGLVFKPMLRGTNVWRHIVATWSDDRLAVYLNGVLLGEKPNPKRTDMRRVKRAIMRFGTGGEGRRASGLVLDDIVVFSNALTKDEVRILASSDKPLRAEGTVNLPEREEFADAKEPPSDSFILHSWGGGFGESIVFRKTMGINCVNVKAGNIPLARAFAREGLFVNLRVENSGEWKMRSRDEIASRVRTLLWPYRHLKNWRSTLVNSEVYGASRIRLAVSNEAWRASASKRLGFDPELGFGFAPPALDYRKLGIAPFTGVLPTDCRSLNTLNWFLREGDPVYGVNQVVGETIHAMRSDVVVWSEPSPPAFGLDMLADWIYDYSTDFCLYNFLWMDAHACSQGLKFMPTLSASYHHSWIPRGRHPTALDEKGNPLGVDLAQSCDEVIIKTWMALGATQADALSYFNAGMWEKGADNAKRFAADPATPVTCVAEPEFAERYGRFVRDEFLPVAEKLRGQRLVRAKLAYAPLPESLFAGTQRWLPHHYHRMLGICLAQGPVAFDVLDEKDLRPEILSQYRYVLVPMLGNVISKSHYDAFCAVSKTTKVVTDSYCDVRFPNMEKLKLSMPYGWTVSNLPSGGFAGDLKVWLHRHSNELHKSVLAWTDQDGVSAYTFVKELPHGQKAVLVVNNARESRSLWPQFCTDSHYCPVAAPNRITVHFNVRGVVREKTLDFMPAEAKLFELK